MSEKNNKQRKKTFYEKYGKRVFDIICSLLAIIIFGIPMLIIAILIKIKLGSPVIFKQKRIGKDNKEFVLYKFRSMTDARDEKGVYLPDDQRITKFGRFIRKTSIDELPSVFNILRGQMSVIGPRPMPIRYGCRFTKEQIRRHEVKPGLSNPSTTNGRNAQSWEQQFKGDVWYVDNISFATDIKSIFDTIRVVFTHEGVVAEDGSNRGEFIGTADIETLQTDSEGNYMKI